MGKRLKPFVGKTCRYLSNVKSAIYNRYSIEQGPTKPSFHDMQERQEQEQRWLEKINRLERQARDFISRLNSEF